MPMCNNNIPFTPRRCMVSTTRRAQLSPPIPPDTLNTIVAGNRLEYRRFYIPSWAYTTTAVMTVRGGGWNSRSRFRWGAKKWRRKVWTNTALLHFYLSLDLEKAPNNQFVPNTDWKCNKLTYTNGPSTQKFWRSKRFLKFFFHW